jgi:hypothetical protein
VNRSPNLLKKIHWRTFLFFLQSRHVSTIHVITCEQHIWFNICIVSFLAFGSHLKDRWENVWRTVIKVNWKEDNNINYLYNKFRSSSRHVMKQLQIIILSKLYLHVIYIPPPHWHTHTCMHTRMHACAHTHTHTGEGVGLYSGGLFVHNFTPYSS